ncbi:MAG: substrate-binding domain-containing protein [Desulfovibrio sp.]|nr:substrate-binding domain-containing protein [Desulfovibrio sp.]MCA1987084.1 substrate-binding domain-containing protein [Desulfovibrio sp.]
MHLFRIGLLTVCLLALGVAGAAAEDKTLLMATTTSTADTGLLDALVPLYKEKTGVEIKFTAVGTGQALKLGENCDADVVMVHAPAAEKEFQEKGFGVDRTEVFYNDFVVIGPAADPAGIKGKTVAEALKTIMDKQAVFISRGDDSGTHKAEQKLWKTAGVDIPEKASWYVSAGQGMGKTIQMADERGGYTLADRGSYIKYEDSKKGAPGLVVIVEGDKALFNQYSVMPVNPTHCPKAKHELAEAFRTWMVTKEAQDFVGSFALLGKPLFTPNATP